jgi:hypothetical protein
LEELSSDVSVSSSTFSQNQEIEQTFFIERDFVTL